jgi:hypothetical protein
MHKLILSIIAVALLQIGFITYVTTDETGNNARIYKVPTISQPVIPAGENESIAVASLDEDPFFKRDAAKFRSVTKARFARTGDVPRRRTTRAIRKTRLLRAPFVPEEVIITYAVHKPYKFVERESFRSVAVDNSSIMNRSEIAEPTVIKPQKSNSNPVLNVIKKPFSWIRTLGSKLK